MRGAADIAAETLDLRQQIFPLEQLARVPQGQAGDAVAQREAVAVLACARLRLKLARLDRAVPLAKDQHPLDHVAKLADVAGPAHRVQHRHGVVGQVAQRQPLGRVELFDEAAGERADILAPVAQGRDRDRDDVQAVVKLLPEAADLDLVGEIAVGRAEDAQVHPHPVGPARPLELLLGQDPQDLGLGAQRHVRDLVEVDDAAMRLFQQARFHAALGRFPAEQHLLHPLGFDGGAGDDDERRLGAGAVGVNVAGGEFLARPWLARQHHPTVRPRDLVEIVAQAPERPGMAQHFSGRAVAAAQRRVFAAQAAGFHRPADNDHQLVDVERLFDEVVGALPDRGDRDLDVAVARDDDDRHVGIVRLGVLEDVEPVHPAVLEPDVEDHQRGLGRVDRRQRLVAVGGKAGRKPLVLKDVRDQFADVAFVVDDQNVTHMPVPPALVWSCATGSAGRAGVRGVAGFRPWRRGGPRRRVLHRSGSGCRRVPRRSS